MQINTDSKIIILTGSYSLDEELNRSDKIEPKRGTPTVGLLGAANALERRRTRSSAASTLESTAAISAVNGHFCPLISALTQLLATRTVWIL